MNAIRQSSHELEILQYNTVHLLNSLNYRDATKYHYWILPTYVAGPYQMH